MAVNQNYGDMGSQQMGPAMYARCSQMQKVLAELFRRESGMSQTFQKGEQSNLVYLLQAALYLNGYNLEINGNYDAATETAVRMFQRNHGLAENGTAQPDMLRALFPAPPQPVSSAAPKPISAAMPVNAAMPAAMPAQPAARPAPPVPPAAVMPLPAPAPSISVPNQPWNGPTEYNVRLSERNPEAIINVSYYNR
ncbi:MAG: peptidoglycan-binding protein [Oscillospiraceae bacterium]|nr:peptidoglycan-binding protein [Oscillospiraceae bacterium]